MDEKKRARARGGETAVLARWVRSKHPETAHGPYQGGDLSGRIEGGETGPHGPCLQGTGSAVGQRGTVETGADRDPLFGKPGSHLFAIHALHPEGDHTSLMGQPWRGVDSDALQTAQCMDTLGSQTTLMRQDVHRTLARYKTQSLQQPGGAWDVVGSGLQPIGQEIRHLLKH